MKLKNICSAYEQYKQDVKASARACVKEGGGQWVGIQEGMLGSPALVLFNTPSGTTLALKTSEITAQLVRDKIAATKRRVK